MALSVEDLEDHKRYRQILTIPYDELIIFVMDYIRRKSLMMVFFWLACLLSLLIALNLRINIGYFPERNIIFHSILGLIIFPVLCIPLHEFLHIIPYFLAGGRKIRIGMDLKQYLFYVTAHRHVATACEFRIVAIMPFLVICIASAFLIYFLPGLWKWSMSLFMFVHITMCAGDFAMLNFYFLNRHKKIFTWDDADQKIAYFYEEI
jgi:Putative zincin peptidase